MSRPSTEHGPAMTVSEPSPIVASRTWITVSSARNSRDVSLNGREMGVTVSTAAMLARPRISSDLRGATSPTTAITVRSAPTWSYGVRPSARMRLLTASTSASVAELFMTTNIDVLPGVGRETKKQRSCASAPPGTTWVPV